MRFCPATSERWALAALGLLSAAVAAHPHHDTPEAEVSLTEATATLNEAEIEQLALVLSELRALRIEQAERRAGAESRAEAARLAATGESQRRHVLQRYGLDAESFEALRTRLRADPAAQRSLRQRMGALQAAPARLPVMQ